MCRQANSPNEGGRSIAHTPMARFGTPEDLIGPVLLLLSEAGSFGASGFEKRAQSFGQGANVSVASEIPKRSGLSLQHQMFQV